MPSDFKTRPISWQVFEGPAGGEERRSEDVVDGMIPNRQSVGICCDKGCFCLIISMPVTLNGLTDEVPLNVDAGDVNIQVHNLERAASLSTSDIQQPLPFLDFFPPRVERQLIDSMPEWCALKVRIGLFPIICPPIKMGLLAELQRFVACSRG